MKAMRTRALTLMVLLLIGGMLTGQEIPYGLNDKAGKRLDVGDAELYYEVYGEGPPLLLLHGGMFGYIDEYRDRIPELSKRYQVIAVATRGHGRSELGTRPLSYRLFAEDAHSILRAESTDSASIVGFSDGAITAYLFAATYPEATAKVVALAGGFGSGWFHPAALDYLRELTPQVLERQFPDFIEERQKISAEPDRWDEFIVALNAVNMKGEFISPEEVEHITCPVLVVGGDRDDYFRLDNFTHSYQALSEAYLAIIPNCNHVDLISTPVVFDDFVYPFLAE